MSFYIIDDRNRAERLIHSDVVGADDPILRPLEAEGVLTRPIDAAEVRQDGGGDGLNRREARIESWFIVI